MLQPGIIPKTEPILNTGIILPEDRYTSVNIIMPKDIDYQLEFSGRTFLLAGGESIFFRIKNGGTSFSIAGREHMAPNIIKIYPLEDEQTPKPQSGIKIKNVISGRDFHWKKYIDVTLPGKVILNRHEDKLLVINELPIEHYLMCVATSEMGADCPSALIEAQTIAARSWMLANVEQKHVHLGMDVCNDDCCQRYQGSTFLTKQSVKGALNTFGQVLIHDEKICDARYSKSCGGVMESFDTIWGGEPLEYMQVKADAKAEPAEWKKPLSDDNSFEKWINSSPKTYCSPAVIPEEDLPKYLGSVDDQGKYFRWTVEVSQEEMTANINRHHDVQASTVKEIKINSRGGSGRVNSLSIFYLDQNNALQTLNVAEEFAVRQTMHKKFLFSSAFLVNTHDKDENGIPGSFELKGAGWGHGAGLCQIGALGMSLNDYSAEEIVLHYYPGSELKKIY